MAKQTDTREITGGPTEHKMYFYTGEGLRAIVHYEKFDEGYRIYASGDPTYGLIAFWLYQSLADGEAPNIVEFGTPSDA